MNNQDEKTQNQGFEFSGERSSQEQTQQSAGNSGYQFESTTTANSTEHEHANNPQNPSYKNTIKDNLPNAGGILAMGIISIVAFCCCYGLISLALGIITLVLAGNAMRKYNENPDLYTISSVKNMKAGRVCAIIGLSLSALILIFAIIAFATGLDIIGLEESLEEIEYILDNPSY